MWPASRYEFTAGTRMSVSPLATRVRWVIPAGRASLLMSGTPVRDRFGLRVADGQRRDLVRSCSRVKIRPANSFPLALLVFVGAKKR